MSGIASGRWSSSLTEWRHHSSCARILRLDVGTNAQVLFEITDRTTDDFVFVCCKRNDRYKAKSEKRPSCDTVCTPVTAVVTLSGHSFVALEVRREI